MQHNELNRPPGAPPYRIVANGLFGGRCAGCKGTVAIRVFEIEGKKEREVWHEDCLKKDLAGRPNSPPAA